MTSVFIIANPSSGQGQADEVINEIENLYHEKNIDPLIKITEGETDIIDFAKKAVEDEIDQVIILGGDGTISLFMNAIKDASYKPIVGIIPTGTMNNLARSLEINLDPLEAAKQIVNGKVTPVDMGSINGDVFISTISAGPVPESAWQVTEEDKENFGTLAYLMGGLKSLNQEKSYEYMIQVDNHEYKLEIDLLVIGVANSIAGYTGFFKEAKIDDGKLHLFFLKNVPIIQKVFELSKLLAEPNQSDDLAAFEQDEEINSFISDFKEIKIDMIDNNTNVTVDGDKGPNFPISIKALPSFIKMIVPQ